MIDPSLNNLLRTDIFNAYRMDETTSLTLLMDFLNTAKINTQAVIDHAKQLAIETREYKKKQGKIDALLHRYDLSSEEGIALMCVAEALLRIPDTATIDKLISDKISTATWRKHLNRQSDLFLNAATWSLLLTGKIYAPTLNTEKSLWRSLKQLLARAGVSAIRPLIMQMMKIIGEQFVMGETMSEALNKAAPLEAKGYQFSYDMLGEAARTALDAERYFSSYHTAIEAIGNVARTALPANNPSISIKLSALHPRYHYLQRERVLETLPPLLLALAQLAKQYKIGLTVDAEEAEVLDLSLDIFKLVYTHPTLKDWDGFGLAIQTYQKRAIFVIDWLADLAAKYGKRIMVRLVKGAYWDAEIKTSQVLGQVGYPVFTRKMNTDISYLACARKLLAYPNYFYPQFATHNAYSVAAILEMMKETNNHSGEFQCLHGMGRPLYDQLIATYPCRIYAPVGTHQHLLGYLVRRLLENGANSSFVNQLANETLPLDKLVYDPITRLKQLPTWSHPRIPLPSDIFKDRRNSLGIDLSNLPIAEKLQQKILLAKNSRWQAASIINGKTLTHSSGRLVFSPANKQQCIGQVNVIAEKDENLFEVALTTATQALTHWHHTSRHQRANMLRKAGELFQHKMEEYILLLTQEAGKCIPDCIGEIREAIDYCRYYAHRAEVDLAPIVLTGPTGEHNELSLHGRGVIVCISPWNFPLAIFIGQIVAALVAGNTVIAKPAEQTPLIAFQAIQLLYQAGIPTDVLQLIIGKGRTVGAKLIADPRVAGVVFTGGTDTAKAIERTLNERPGPIGVLIAETGGQNAMIVDSSALPEQVVMDIVQSAFNSAGQRCSALRVLYLQEEIADTILTMLKGHLEELTLGDPSLLATDIGPLIDESSLNQLKEHLIYMHEIGKFIAAVPYQGLLPGYYFSPCVFELANLNFIKKEVFGPILHVIRYPAKKLDSVLDDIIHTGYGLTLGIHSRIRATIQHIIKRMPVGNIYVNRNMIGAQVGVQPFGGERLSGTGPKAGGPHYLPRLTIERCVSMNTTAVLGNTQLVTLSEEE